MVMKGSLKVKGYFKAWAKAAGLRAIRTFAQSAAASIAVCAFIDEVNWGALLSAAALAAVLSLLNSVGGLPELEKGEDK